jgi:hypothetical protein
VIAKNYRLSNPLQLEIETMKNEHDANRALQTAWRHRTYIYVPAPRRSPVGWLVWALVLAILAGVGVELMRGIMTWLLSGSMM